MKEEILDNNDITTKDIVIEVNLYSVIKRFIDIIISLTSLIPLIILIIIVKILYILSGDFHSIFFNFERIGLNGKMFKMYKFRTMIPNADEELKRILKEDKKLAKEYKKYKKMSNDPRITKVGKLLRISSLDEVPQFLNVLKGDMTLVGPRPYLGREKKDMGKYYKILIKVTPGLTGYWQVNGRNDTDFKERLKLDEKYIKIRSLKLDMIIFFKTFKKLIDRAGAK